MNIMRVQEIKHVNRNRLEYVYSIEGEWSKYFEPANPMWAEYSEPVDQIPDSITVLPLIGNVFPVFCRTISLVCKNNALGNIKLIQYRLHHDTIMDLSAC